MKLLIVSHTPHYIQDGRVVGWEPTTQEINHLALMFEEIRHIAWIHPDAAPSAVLPYSTDRISLIPVKPSGGEGFWEKISILGMAPSYVSIILKSLKWADVVHVRCPSNISLMAVLLLRLCKHPKLRWVKYATNWSPQEKEPWSFSLQRWLLRNNFHNGIVTVNGNWPHQPKHVYSFFNPCILDDQLLCAKQKANEKRFEPPFRFLHVGRLVEQKGLGRALEILARLRKIGIPFRFDVVGDGDREKFVTKTKMLALQDVVQFHGWLNRSALDSLYLGAHFLLFPSSGSEGWPKVLSEAMAYGVVPLAGAISSIPQTLKHLGTGIALPVMDEESFVKAVLNYITNPDRWHQESQNAMAAVNSFTYNSYLRKLKTTFAESWGIRSKILEEVEIQSGCN